MKVCAGITLAPVHEGSSIDRMEVDDRVEEGFLENSIKILFPEQLPGCARQKDAVHCQVCACVCILIYTFTMSGRRP